MQKRAQNEVFGHAILMRLIRVTFTLQTKANIRERMGGWCCLPPGYYESFELILWLPTLVKMLRKK